MIYLLYGENEAQIDKYIEKLMKEHNIETKITYNYKDTNIEDVLEEAAYTDLFGSNKIVILNEAEFLTGSSSLDNDKLNNYINNPVETTVLIFKIVTPKLDERKKIVKLLKEKSKVLEFKLIDSKDLKSYINNYFEERNYIIDINGIEEIKTRLEARKEVIDKELEKLALYKIDDKKITINDIKNTITTYKSNEIFTLVDAVVKKDKSKIFKTYKDLIENKEEPIVIISLLSSQFRLMLSSKILNEEGLDKTKIASLLKEHPYRTELALNNSRNIEKKDLINILYKLALLDLNIKTGEQDKTKALETFLLEI